MLPQTKFPSHLLAAPPAQRLKYFEDKIVAHPHLKQAYDQLIETIYHPAGASLIFVFGPTGVGKTTLRQRVQKRLIEDTLLDLAKDPEHLPVVAVEAIAQGAETFNWKDFYKRGLLAMDEPLVPDKIDYRVRQIQRDGQGHLVIEHRIAPSELRQAFEQCLRHRRPLAFLIDEAQHFKKIPSGRRLLDQMDSVKSLSSVTGTIHVLIGTYELLGLTDLSAQLSRRSVDIHFPRYRPDCPEEVEAFKSVILTLQSHLPVSEEPDLVNHYDYLYEGSVGCVGILKDWLNRALATALKNEQKTLTLAHLQQQAEPTRKLLRMALELKEGEELLLEMEEQRAQLRALLAIAPRQANEARPQAVTPASKSRTHEVGQRQPTRDSVGVK